MTIWTNTDVDLERIQSDITSWRVPGLVFIRDTRLGAITFDQGQPRVAIRATKALRLEQQFDAILHLGPVAAITKSAWPTFDIEAKTENTNEEL